MTKRKTTLIQEDPLSEKELSPATIDFFLSTYDVENPDGTY